MIYGNWIKKKQRGSETNRMWRGVRWKQKHTKKVGQMYVKHVITIEIIKHTDSILDVRWSVY